MQRIANPCTSVRFRSGPPSSKQSLSAASGAPAPDRIYRCVRRHGPESVIADVALTDEVLVVYQGSDAGGRAILLTLTAPLAADQPDDSTVFDMSRLSLALSYISEPTNPDVFTLPAEDF